MELQERDILIFKTLNKLRVLDIDLVKELCNFGGYRVAANRLRILYDNNYLDYYQESVSSKRYYYLAQKGMNVLFPGIKKKHKKGKHAGEVYWSYKEPPKFKKNQLDHEIMISRVLAHLLKCNPELTIDDFQTDREMQMVMPQKRKMIGHCCDLQCEKYRVKIEVELSAKDKVRLARNVMHNTNAYVQLWIAGSNPVYNRVINEKKRNPSFAIKVIKLDEIEDNPIVLSELNVWLFKKNPELAEKLQEIERLIEEKKKKDNLKLDKNH